MFFFSIKARRKELTAKGVLEDRLRQRVQVNPSNQQKLIRIIVIIIIIIDVARRKELTGKGVFGRQD